MRILPLTMLITATSASAAPFDRPIPQPQSATAELWFMLASLMLFAALYAVYWMVNRK